ncbi:MAG: HAD-IIIA family hydrolase [Tepidisphaeraceae bacterium]
MRRPAVFFDRDNTLIIGNEYLGDPAQVVLVAGAAAAVARCRDMGFAVVVVSNQSGVARGMFTEDDVRAVDKKMAELLLAGNRGAVIDRHEFCPFHPDATVPAYKQDSFLRKPKPGMILAAADAMALDLGASWMVGDAPRDITAGQAAGCRTILIMDPTLPPSPAASEASATRADFVVGSLIEAIEVITQQVNKANRPAPAERITPLKLNAEKAPPEKTDAGKPNADRLNPKKITAHPAEKPADRPASRPPTGAAPSRPLATSAPAPHTSPATVPPATDRPAPRPQSDRPPTDRPAPVRPTPKPAASSQTGPSHPAPAAPSVSPIAAAFPKPPAPPDPQREAFQRLEVTCQQLLMEVKKLSDHGHDDFSISKLMAGISQIMALAALPVAYVLYHSDPTTLQLWLITALFLQTFTIALLIMGRQR